MIPLRPQLGQPRRPEPEVPRIDVRACESPAGRPGTFSRGGVRVMRQAGAASVSGPYTGSSSRAKHPRSHQWPSASVWVGRFTGPKTTVPGPGSASTFARISLAV